MILSLSSLSPDDAKWWLGVSELALIASAIILAMGLFGEWPDSESWKKRTLYKLSKAAVIVGVVGELLGDAGIFETSARLQVIEEVAIKNANMTASSAITRAADLDMKAANLNKEAAELRAAASARPWKKEQFDAIQEIKGVVTDVGILWQGHCLECQVLGEYIASALHSAGAQIYGVRSDPDFVGTGIFARLPIGSDLNNHPLIVALWKAELNPLSAYHIPEFSKIRTDIPVIFVLERYLPFLAVPYQPPGQTRWTILPIEKQ